MTNSHQTVARPRGLVASVVAGAFGKTQDNRSIEANKRPGIPGLLL